MSRYIEDDNVRVAINQMYENLPRTLLRPPTRRLLTEEFKLNDRRFYGIVMETKGSLRSTVLVDLMNYAREQRVPVMVRAFHGKNLAYELMLPTLSEIMAFSEPQPENELPASTTDK